MAVAWCINAYDCNGCLIQTLQNLDSACIGVGVQYTAPNPLDDKRIDYIKYTDKCGCTCCLSAENEILIYATNGVIKNLTLTNDDVNEAIKIKWNDIFWSNRAKTIVRYKTWSYPVSITDGTLAIEETTKNQYSSTPFSLSGVLDETTYYITAFAVDSNNVVIWTQQTTITTDFWWHPSANTLARYKLESNANDFSWNNRHLTNSWITFSDNFWIFNGNAKWYYSNQSLFNNLSKFTYSVYLNTQQITNTSYNSDPTHNMVMSITDNWIYQNYDKTIVLYYGSKTAWYNYYNWKYFVEATWISLNTWYLITYTFDWSTMKIYKNWTLISSKSCWWSYTSYTNATLTIWNNEDRWNYVKKYYWKLSNVIVENKVRTAQEILDYFNKTKSKYWIS